MEFIFYIAAFLAGCIISVVLLLLIQKSRGKSIIITAKAEGEAIKRAKLVEVKEKYLQLKSEYDKQVNARNAKLQS